MVITYHCQYRRYLSPKKEEEKKVDIEDKIRIWNLSP